MRDRLLLARELLAESGSIFVQISDENVHHVRELMDEVIGERNFVSLISFRKTTGVQSRFVASVSDYLLWYAKDKTKCKFNNLYREKTIDKNYKYLLLPDGKIRNLIQEEYDGRRQIPEEGRIFRYDHLLSSGQSNQSQEFFFEGKIYKPPVGNHWKTSIEGLNRLEKAGRIRSTGKTINYIRLLSDFPFYPYTNFWDDTTVGGDFEKIYVVQTTFKVIARCLLMTTDPGDLVFDPTCGSGTTAYVAEQWGRRWITCDTSRVALTLAKQRLMTAVYDYYELAHPQEGVGSGFKYKTVPHITLKSIANNPEIREGMTRAEIEAAIARHAPQETLYDQPQVDRKKKRVSGPFTVEAVPAPAVKSVEEILESKPQPADTSIARSGETLRQAEWRDELLRSGIRAKAGQHIRFARLEPLPGTRWLHADGETRPSDEGADSCEKVVQPTHLNASRFPSGLNTLHWNNAR
jgi:adenine-specific DNA-methyltransferase